MTSVADETKVGDLPSVIRIDEGQLKGHVDRVVRQSVEETLNGLLDAEAEALCGAKRYQRSADRVDTRAGHYRRTLMTKAGEVELNVPRLRKLSHGLPGSTYSISSPAAFACRPIASAMNSGPLSLRMCSGILVGHLGSHLSLFALQFRIAPLGHCRRGEVSRPCTPVRCNQRTSLFWHNAGP